MADENTRDEEVRRLQKSLKKAEQVYKQNNPLFQTHTVHHHLMVVLLYYTGKGQHTVMGGTRRPPSHEGAQRSQERTCKPRGGITPTEQDNGE